jgi:hypothetical protein
VPLLNAAFWNSGELVVLDTCGVPSKLFPLEHFRRRGTMVTGTVVVGIIIVLFQNTPAQFYGRPELVQQMT